MKAYKKYFCIISMLICLGISFMFCSCESEKQENDNNNTQIAQPENTNYPVEGIWCGSIAGSFLRNIKNEYLYIRQLRRTFDKLYGGRLHSRSKRTCLIQTTHEYVFTRTYSAPDCKLSRTLLYR